MTNKSIAEAFYQAFQEKDADRMISFYDEKIVFEDPAFGQLKGREAKMMWKMLCSSANDLTISYEIVAAEGDRVDVNWEAKYTFSKSGRKVHNKIKASLFFKEALIVEHIDKFSLYRWASQALGLQGYLLAWTGFFKKKLNQQTSAMLHKYMKQLNA
jgi:ketosteroid isomerase-like protein